MVDRQRTATSRFGVGRRESHDASGFYGRFRPPELSAEEEIAPPSPVAQPFVHGDARHMDAVADNSVALVVTSPPYFAGKAYEEELDRDGVPASYLEYLELLGDVFAQCKEKLEPGGRIAVNIANLGRKPYRSLSADVIRILQDDLGLLLRGEIVWRKAEGATGSCAWGSFRSAANPVLRDLTERVVVASKGRFDRAIEVKRRRLLGLPAESSLMTDDFLSLTLDVWEIPSESARRVGHPAPFPVELPEQLIRLYTFEDDLVLDPFMGSGSALVAAARTGRRYVGYDLDASYVAIAEGRVREEGLRGMGDAHREEVAKEGKAALKLAEAVLEGAGFSVVGRRRRVPRTGVVVDIVGRDAAGDEWFFDVPGGFTSHRGGLLRNDAAWKSLGRASALRGRSPGTPVVLLTTDLPHPKSDGDTALRSAGPGLVFDVVDVCSKDGRERLQLYAKGSAGEPAPGFWALADLGRIGR